MTDSGLAVHKNFVPGKKSFYGKTSFAQGAAYLAGKETGSEKQDARIITDQMTLCQIGLVLHHHGRDVFYPLLPEGKPWFEAKGEIEFLNSELQRSYLNSEAKKEERWLPSACR